MKHEEYEKAINFWNKRAGKSMPADILKSAVEEFLVNSVVCALATGTGDFVRCTPLEYSYHGGKFWIFTEGGEKFIGLEKNKNVSLAVFEKNPDFGELKSVQVLGTAELIEPMSDEYIAHADYKEVPVTALKKLVEKGEPMHLICVTPIKMDVLFSDFKKQGYDSRQKIEYF